MNAFLGRPAEMYRAMPLRRRSVWEAADSGILLWRECFLYFIPFFAVPVWIVSCSLRLLPGDARFLSYLIIWWLKPLFDRTVLHVVSLKFFGASGSLGYRELRRGFWGAMASGLLGDLLWRRFSPYRSSRMPIRVLERAGGKQFRYRKMALVPGGLNFCSFISFFGLAAEGMLLLGEAIFVVSIIRMFFPSAIEYFIDSRKTAEVFIFAAYCLNFFLMESLYVCMGFGIYINSRVEVEGWDLKLLFQKFAGSEERITGDAAGADKSGMDAPASENKGPPPALNAIFVIWLFALLSISIAPPLLASEEGGELQAEQGEMPIEFSIEVFDWEAIGSQAGDLPTYFPGGFPDADPEAFLQLEEILASPDFGSEKDGWSIRLKQSDDDWVESNFSEAPWMKILRRIFGYALRLFVILALAASLGFSIFWFWKRYRQLFGGKGRSSGSGSNYANPLFSTESPESLFARSESLYQLGNLRDAWAACLQGCLGSFTCHCSLSFEPDATEYGCLDLVLKALPGEAEAFGELVRNWIFLAYGGRDPDDGAFERALAYGRSIGAGSIGGQE